MSHYIGVLEGKNDVWSVWLPDLPGCVGAGADAEAAIDDVTSALSEVASIMVSEGTPLPVARDAATLMSDEWVSETIRNGDVFIAIPLIIEKNRPVRANISLDAGILEAIDTAAKRRGLTRSAFIASTMREKILSEA